MSLFVFERQNVPGLTRQSLSLLIGALLIGFTIYTSATVPLQPTVHRGLFVLGVVLLTLLLRPLPGRFVWLDALLALGATVSFGYLVLNWEQLAYRAIFEPMLHEYMLGGIAIFAVLETTRRTVGWPLVAVAVIALLYAYFGRQLPGDFAHRGFSIERIVTSQYLTHQGLLGSITGTAVTMVATFLVFGALLQHVGVADLFLRIASKVSFGHYGRAAKVSVVSSALMGTLSGSSTANVVTTGTTTIPVMLRAGFPRNFAPAVEAVASAGGQIMPPVMGVAAFLMAELTGIPYWTIAVAAVIPAILYFVCAFIQVDLEARRLNLVTAADTGARVSGILRQLYLLIPIVVLCYFLFAMYSPTKAAFWACVATALVALPNWRSVFNNPTAKAMIKDFSSAAITVILACATAGIIVGVLALTGASLPLSYVLVELAGDNLLLLLIYVMVLCIILGMGMPTPAAYAVAAAFAAPMLVNSGIDMLAAHMFVLYYASLSSITPPVAVAAYAAASVANASPMKTSVIACKLGLTAYIIPSMFIQNPAFFLGQAPLLETLIATLTALLGICALGCATIGYFRSPISLPERAGYFISAIMMMNPGIYWSIGGMVFGLLLLSFHLIRFRRRTGPEG